MTEHCRDQCDRVTLTEVIIACELKWRYRDVDEVRFMQMF